MSFAVPPSLETAIDAMVSRYPVRRSASLMVLHALQEHFGFISGEAMEWTAKRLDVQPIHIYELVTFYPMLRQQRVGKFHLKVCRTLSCALGGANDVYRCLCDRLGLDPHSHGAQTTKDGKFTVELVECLASCHTAPVMMCNDDLHEHVSPQTAEAMLSRCK